jgi:hypothetical protein
MTAGFMSGFCTLDEKKVVARKETNLIPVFVGKDMTRVAPLNPGTVQQNIDIVFITDHRRHEFGNGWF